MFLILEIAHFQTSVCRREGGDCGFCAVVVGVEAGTTIEGTLEIAKAREVLPLTSGSPNGN